MEWPKLKNIILAILAMTNLCLFFFVAHREWQQYHFQNQAQAATRWPFWPAAASPWTRTFSPGTGMPCPP